MAEPKRQIPNAFERGPDRARGIGRDSLPPEKGPFHPFSRILAMAIGGALSLLSTLFRGAWGWTAAITGGALVKRGVTGQRTGDTLRSAIAKPPEAVSVRPRSSDPGALVAEDRPLSSRRGGAEPA
jgi:hypothetical protein